MKPSYLNCPSCHTPVPVDRYDRAFAGAASFLVCPACNFAFPMPLPEAIAPPAQVVRAAKDLRRSTESRKQDHRSARQD